MAEPLVAIIPAWKPHLGLLAVLPCLSSVFVQMPGRDSNPPARVLRHVLAALWRTACAA